MLAEIDPATGFVLRATMACYAVATGAAAAAEKVRAEKVG